MIFLHGWGLGGAQETEAFVEFLKVELGKKGVLTVHAPTYHPSGDEKRTSLPRFLEELRVLAQSIATRKLQLAIVGFSVGGFLAATFQELYPDLVARVVLLGPAIDNFARNFEGRPIEQWYMPESYVKELSNLSARPAIRVPVMLIHGDEETDAGGSAMWRVKEWAAREKFDMCFYPEGLGHCMEVADAIPGGRGGLIDWLVSGAAPIGTGSNAA